MIDFLKSFLSNDKSPEEQALMAKQRQHDVMVLESDCDEEEDEEHCATQKQNGGCGGCGCR